ncbi:MAG TPA: Gfo/Idh/MocA family oxidoreductase, partial [Polyangiaceae bacterium]
MSARPKVGFLGLGWIGLARLDALRESERVEVAALCDSDPDALRKGIERAPEARTSTRYEDMLEMDLDALVIATPSALHARQCIAAFERGLAVFCQKPLARTAREARAVLDAARTHDRLLRVDFCYRHTEALSRTREVVRSGELGIPFAAELVFHNAYGPDNRWAQDPALAGGGCLMDLGVHLIDALLW